MHIRTVNSFLSWLHEEGRLSAPLRVRLLRSPHRTITLLSANELQAVARVRPESDVQRRTQVLLLVLLDTGIRITEALTLARDRVDMDTCMFVVMGKGAKERSIPFSQTLRKHLWRWLGVRRTRHGDLLFATADGQRLTYRNVYRDIAAFCRAAGVVTRVRPHLFRHQFASAYIQRGGDLYRLSRLLGHTNIATTATYLRSMGIEQIREHHERLTPLAFDGRSTR